MSEQVDAQSKILELIKKRKNYLNVIENSISSSDTFFVKCFRLDENIESVLYKNP